MLLQGADGYAIDSVFLAGFQRHEFDIRAERCPGNGKTGFRMLPLVGFFEIGMATVNDDLEARYIGGHKERKAHDVVPMRMGLENIDDLFLVRIFLGHDGVAEFPAAAAHVAQHMLFAAAFDFDAGRVSAKSAGDRECELLVDESLKPFGRADVVPNARPQGAADFFPYRDRIQGRWQGPARSPKPNQHS